MDISNAETDASSHEKGESAVLEASIHNETVEVSTHLTGWRLFATTIGCVLLSWADPRFEVYCWQIVLVFYYVSILLMSRSQLLARRYSALPMIWMGLKRPIGSSQDTLWHTLVYYLSIRQTVMIALIKFKNRFHHSLDEIERCGRTQGGLDLDYAVIYWLFCCMWCCQNHASIVSIGSHKILFLLTLLQDRIPKFARNGCSRSLFHVDTHRLRHGTKGPVGILWRSGFCNYSISHIDRTSICWSNRWTFDVEVDILPRVSVIHLFPWSTLIWK